MAKYDFELFVKFSACPCSGGRSDDATEAFNVELAKYKEQYGMDMIYRVYSLSANLSQFRANDQMSELLRTEGHDALPVLMLNGEIVSKGQYPDSSELARIFGE